VHDRGLLVIVLITKFLLGAWIAILAMVVIFITIARHPRHYDRVSEELVPSDEGDRACPRATTSCARVEGAQTHAAGPGIPRGDPPDTLTALTVNVD